jgi:hypothetical protein
MRELRPENDPRLRIFAPDGPRRFDAGELGHLNVEDADFGFVLERERNGFFTVARFQHRRVRREIALEYLAQVSALGHIIFGNEN